CARRLHPAPLRRPGRAERVRDGPGTERAGRGPGGTDPRLHVRGRAQRAGQRVAGGRPGDRRAHLALLRAGCGPLPGGTSHATHELSARALRLLLARLDPDPDRAGAAYEALRRALVKFFDWRGARVPEEGADETLDRLARQL